MHMSNSLYSLIKKLSQQKGKKLKIICNINDVIRAMKSSAVYGASDKSISFKEYHNIFWEKMSYKDPSGVEGNNDENKQMVKSNNERFKKYQKERSKLKYTIIDSEEYKKEVAKLEKKYMGDWDYLSNRPFTTIAADLLKCLKEGSIIEELVFGLASWNKRKENLSSVLNKVRINEFNENFKQFSECFFINGDNQEIKDYWRRAMVIRPDFDIWILTLDPGNISKEAFKSIYNNCELDKIYIFPEYECNKIASTKKNVHFVRFF